MPTQANYVLCEVLGGYSSTKLSEVLLADYGIFIKDLSTKGFNGQYIRVAVRTMDENNKIVKALQEILG